MKVTNNKLGHATPTKIESGKMTKSEGARGLLSNNDVTSAKGGPDSSSSINLSDRAQTMKKLKELASTPPTVDETRVAQFQKMIDEGRYKVDADAVADRLVDEHLTFED
jgi:negative regulator of flagellin synthesis FlgM